MSLFPLRTVVAPLRRTFWRLPSQVPCKQLENANSKSDSNDPLVRHRNTLAHHQLISDHVLSQPSACPNVLHQTKLPPIESSHNYILEYVLQTVLILATHRRRPDAHDSYETQPYAALSVAPRGTSPQALSTTPASPPSLRSRTPAERTARSLGWCSSVPICAAIRASCMVAG